MIGFYNYTVYLTYVSMLISAAGIFLAMGGHPWAAVICLGVSGVCDMFDGKIARTKKVRTEEEKRFGIQIDSLCDIVCFGVLPAVIGMSLGADSWWQLTAGALFILCGLIRLAYFNVTEEVRQAGTTACRRQYLGLPITASAFFCPLAMCFRNIIGAGFPYVYTVLLLVLGILYISPIKVAKPGKYGCIGILLGGAAILVLLLVL